MQEPLCSIEIVNKSGQLTAKVQSGNGRYVEIESEDLEYLLEMVYEDIQMDIHEDYW